MSKDIKCPVDRARVDAVTFRGETINDERVATYRIGDSGDWLPLPLETIAAEPPLETLFSDVPRFRIGWGADRGVAPIRLGAVLVWMATEGNAPFARVAAKLCRRHLVGRFTSDDWKLGGETLDRWVTRTQRHVMSRPQYRDLRDQWKRIEVAHNWHARFRGADSMSLDVGDSISLDGGILP